MKIKQEDTSVFCDFLNLSISYDIDTKELSMCDQYEQIFGFDFDKNTINEIITYFQYIKGSIK